MNKKQKQAEDILQHGFKLMRVFNITDLGPVALCKKVHRLEVEAHRWNERLCSGEIDPSEQEEEKKVASILKRLDAILNFKAQGIPVFINGDPRGYALKIDDEYVKAHNLDIHRDWGGYGIIAPEF